MEMIKATNKTSGAKHFEVSPEAAMAVLSLNELRAVSHSEGKLLGTLFGIPVQENPNLTGLFIQLVDERQTVLGMLKLHTAPKKKSE